MKLRDARVQAFLTQAELAEKADVSIATVSAIERGVERPTVRTARKLAKALGVRPQELDEAVDYLGHRRKVNAASPETDGA